MHPLTLSLRGGGGPPGARVPANHSDDCASEYSEGGGRMGYIEIGYLAHNDFFMTVTQLTQSKAGTVSGRFQVRGTSAHPDALKHQLNSLN